MKTKLLISFAWLLLILAACKKDEMESLKPAFSVSKQEILAGESLTFTDLSTGQPSSWNWEFEGGTPARSDLSGPVVTYSQPGTYAVTLEIRNAAGAAVEKKTGYITVSYRDIAADFSQSATTIKQEESVTFTDKSSGMPNKWAWEFRSGNVVLTSDQQNPVVKFSTPGVYTVKLTASNPKGAQTVVRENLLTVVDITSVEAAFDSDQTGTYSGGSIQFNDKSIGTVTSWNWTFEGASVSSSTAQHPRVTYPSPGRYRVKLVAANATRSSTVEKDGYILVVPANGLTAFYPLDGSINDAGPSKLVSTAVGQVAFTDADRTLAPGRTATFTSSGGFVVPDNDAMNFGTGDYSVSCWIKTTTTTSGMVWQESGGKGSGDNQTWLRLLGSATNLTSFATEDALNGSVINLTRAANGNVAATNDGVWHHIVCVRSGTLTAIYIDGVKIREATATGVKNTSNTGAFKVGMQEGTGGYSRQFVGQIDDLIIYKKALSQTEINTLKNL
ncbi:PKD domain-containing protein [Pedobacter sp. SYP-B3415]|uniref:PKD domain-containing protein n=1 Tax=Pedobacter sp. SYP-B3415 TaxID=2496641 RepID=UPI0013EA5EB3|nr:PKD domain-containing protein [Pedobacter sp. SYP-B3415]